MKKLINGHIIDTDKDELLAKWDNGRQASDMHYISEDCYVTKKGDKYLVKEGVVWHGNSGGFERWVESDFDFAQWIESRRIEITEEIEKHLQIA